MRITPIARPGGRLGHRTQLALAGLVAAGALAGVLLGGDDRADPPRAPGDARDLTAALAALASGAGEAAAEALTEPSAEVRPPRYAIATVRDGEEVELRRTPGGKLLETLGDRTEFGSKRSFWIARVRGDWLGVPAAELPNGVLGWIRDDRSRLELFETRYSVVADVSLRALVLRHGNRVLERVPVTVGAPGSPTPPGAYAITDGLAGAGVGPYYGCCILALTGHQPNLPSDWLGGDRIAIHGTPGALGLAASAGCLRASDVDMVRLFARLPLGAPVFIVA
jgi:hypothetical protein